MSFNKCVKLIVNSTGYTVLFTTSAVPGETDNDDADLITNSNCKNRCLRVINRATCAVLKPTYVATTLSMQNRSLRPESFFLKTIEN